MCIDARDIALTDKHSHGKACPFRKTPIPLCLPCSGWSKRFARFAIRRLLHGDPALLIDEQSRPPEQNSVKAKMSI